MNSADKPDWLVSSHVHAQESPKAKTSEFVADVYRMYMQNFGKFYKLMVSPTLLALVMYTVRPLLISKITSGLDGRREILKHPTVMMEMLFVNLGTFFLAWFFEAFSFAAVSDVVGTLYRGTGVAEGDGYTRARERMWEVFKISLATYIPLIIGFVVLMVLLASVIMKLGSHLLGNYWFSVGLFSFEMLLLCAGLIGYAFAIPIVMATDTTAGKALRASWRMTDGHEGKLILFVAESLVGAVIAMYAMAWLSYIIFAHVNGGGWGLWATSIATALVGASVQAPMLIAFALLYFKVAEPQGDASSV